MSARVLAGGVVFVSASRADEILETAEAIAGRERSMAEAVRKGVPVSRFMGGDYETMLGEERNG